MNACQLDIEISYRVQKLPIGFTILGKSADIQYNKVKVQGDTLFEQAKIAVVTAGKVLPPDSGHYLLSIPISN